MKIIVYLSVFCMLFMLLVLSFAEHVNDTASAEWDAVSATFENELTDDDTESVENATEMNQNAQIKAAQKENLTAFDFAVIGMHALANKIVAGLKGLFDYVAKYTRESAYQVASDVAELIYPARPKLGQKYIATANSIVQEKKPVVYE